MSILVLGTFASSAVFLGLPLGRVQHLSAQRKRLFTGATVGFLFYLILDLLGHARELPLEVLGAARLGEAAMSLAVMLIASFFGGLVVGWLAGAGLQRLWSRTRAGAGRENRTAQGQAMRRSLLIAVSIGLYNFLQGMAIGEAGRFTVHSAVSESGAEVLLLVGFLLQNAAKSFFIISPLIGAGVPVSWRYLLTLGAVAGLPTLLGTLFGSAYWNPNLFVSFLTVAAGMTAFTLRELLRSQEIQGAGRSAFGGILIGFVVALIVTFALEMGQYSLPELMSSYWL